MLLGKPCAGDKLSKGGYSENREESGGMRRRNGGFKSAVHKNGAVRRVRARVEGLLPV